MVRELYAASWLCKSLGARRATRTAPGHGTDRAPRPGYKYPTGLSSQVALRAVYVSVAVDRWARMLPFAPGPLTPPPHGRGPTWSWSFSFPWTTCHCAWSPVPGHVSALICGQLEGGGGRGTSRSVFVILEPGSLCKWRRNVRTDDRACSKVRTSYRMATRQGLGRCGFPSVAAARFRSVAP